MFLDQELNTQKLDTCRPEINVIFEAISNLHTHFCHREKFYAT